MQISEPMPLFYDTIHLVFNVDWMSYDIVLGLRDTSTKYMWLVEAQKSTQTPGTKTRDMELMRRKVEQLKGLTEFMRYFVVGGREVEYVILWVYHYAKLQLKIM